MGLFDRHKEKRELNKQERVSRREMQAAGSELQQTWLEKADQLQAEYAGAIQAAASVDAGELQRTAERMRRITTDGVAGRATVISARACGAGMGGVGVAVELELNLTEGPGAPRALTVRQDVMGGPESYPAGLEVPVKIDPDSPDDALVWADAEVAADGGAQQLSAEDRTTRLEALAALREQGVLSDEQFKDLKSRLLGTG